MSDFAVVVVVETEEEDDDGGGEGATGLIDVFDVAVVDVVVDVVDGVDSTFERGTVDAAVEVGIAMPLLMGANFSFDLGIDGLAKPVLSNRRCNSICSRKFSLPIVS